MDEKLKALNTIALWLIVLLVAGYLIFKPDNSLNKDTVERLTTIVDKLGVASENMTKLADSQRDWFTNLQRQASQGEFNRNTSYGTVYDKYGYKDSQDTGLTLDDLYNSRMQQQTNDLGSEHIRGVKDADRKDGPVQKSDSKPQG